MSLHTARLVVGTVSGLIVGGLVGYIVTQRALETKFEALLDEEVSKLKQYYKGKYEPEESVEDKEVVPEPGLSQTQIYVREAYEKVKKETATRKSEHARIVSEGGYSSIAEAIGDAIDKGQTVEAGIIIEAPKDSGDALADAWVSDKPIPPLAYGAPIDYTDPSVKDMIANRDPERPYVITVDEFMEDHMEFEKQSLTYFEGDDSLCDERELIIPNIDDVIGEENLDMFGLYSRDREIVYVRNENISSDFEIAFDERTYVEAVAGFKYRKANRNKQEDD